MQRQSEANPPLIVGRCAPMRELRRVIALYGRNDATVLVCGETGTGKDLVARSVHGCSARSQEPFVSVNCASIPDALLESEFFGSEKGAYTSSVDAREGLVAAAEGGVLFLDEIGDLPLALQAKLLRLLESGQYRPVGSSRERRADIRIIAATHRDLPAAIDAGHFREDLFYRLDVLRIDVPSLAERRGDIPLLVDHFINSFAGDNGSLRVGRVTEAALADLVGRPWPGNVRELRHTVQRALIKSEGGPIEQFEWSLRSRAQVKKPDALTRVAQMPTNLGKTRESLAALLIRHRGRVSDVARELGVSIRTVQRRMLHHQLSSLEFRRAPFL